VLFRKTRDCGLHGWHEEPSVALPLHCVLSVFHLWLLSSCLFVPFVFFVFIPLFGALAIS
jgi:hypothetical protein